MNRDTAEDVEKILNERGFSVDEVSDEVFIARFSNLSLLVWMPEKDYLLIDDPQDFAEKMGLRNVDGVVVISHRAFYLADELSRLIDFLKTWSGVHLNVKVYAVDEYMLDEQLERAIDVALTTFTTKVSNVDERDGPCPRCGLDMAIRYKHTHRSSIYGDTVTEYILVCDRCSIKIHRVELSGGRNVQ